MLCGGARDPENTGMSPLSLHWFIKEFETMTGKGLCLALGQQNWIISMVPIIVLCFSMLMEIVWLPPKNPNSVVGF